MDSYHQMSLSFNDRDLEILEEQKKYYGYVYLTNPKVPARLVPLIVYCKDTEFLRTRTISKNSSPRKYEIDLNREIIDLIRKRETLRADFPSISYRTIFIKHECVIG